MPNGISLEYCISCGSVTDKAGRADDSLYCEYCDEGPFCEICCESHMTVSCGATHNID